jgi:hypothetical protein
MVRLILKVWSVLLLLPLIPVFLLYAFFEGQNYFELQQTAKGIVATGPIAAYVFIVGLGWRIYLKLIKETLSASPALEELPGHWKFRSISSHGTAREGNCYISNERGRLVLNGDFQEDGKQAGLWNSEVTQIKGNKLIVVYSLQELKEGKPVKFDGLSTVSFGAPPVSRMRGIWIVVGEADMSGSIEYTRVS